MNAESRSCPERELLLHGLADGELDAANALSVENHLQDCEECAAAFSEIRNQRELLGSSDLRLRAPAELRGRILAAIAAEEGTEAVHEKTQKSVVGFPQIRALRFRFPKAGLALSAMALAASLVLFVNSENHVPRLTDELVAGHVRSLLVSHLTDVASSDQHTVKPWFLGKLDFAPPVVDLAQKDFPLIGGRLDYIGGRVIPAIVYKHRGHIINLFVWPKGQAEGATGTFDGYHIISWTQDGFTYSAVSDLNLQELYEFQRDLKHSLT
jgi:anti-sigma factor RsiW